MNKSLVSIIALCLITISCPHHALAQGKLTGKQAIDAARKIVKGSEWQIAFLSNTGVTQSYSTEKLKSAREALMKKDGKAGQWVVEFYKNSPKDINEGGRKGVAYPLRAFLVTSNSASEMPTSVIKVPKQLPPLKSDYINNLDKALGLAIKQVKIKFDVCSVASDVRSDGTTSWRFRFYDMSKENIIAKVNISGDGNGVLGW